MSRSNPIPAEPDRHYIGDKPVISHSKDDTHWSELPKPVASKWYRPGMYDTDNAPESPTEADREPIREGEN